MAKKKEEPVGIPCTFGNLNVGDETARVGVKIRRGNLTVNQVDKSFCCRRLKGTIVAVMNGAGGDGQMSLTPDDNLSVDGIFDCKGFSATGKRISFGLTFALSGIDLDTLCKFAKRDGRLVVDSSEVIPEEEEEEEEEDAETAA